MAISQATRKNWERLGVRAEGRLIRRANKSRSLRRILPRESICDGATPGFLTALPALCESGRFRREEVLCAVAVKLLERSGILGRAGVQTLLRKSGFLSAETVPLPPLPEQEPDLLGISYQFLLFEGEKNRLGSYYTPPRVVKQMLRNGDLRPGEAFLDPCCGSGAFLLAQPATDPEQLWGCDRDPVAVFLARINLLCRFPERDFSPRIFCCDYLEDPAPALRERQFHRIATNPPWGAELRSAPDKGAKEESFDRFFRRAWEQLTSGGGIAFLFPESVLTVGKHRAFRTFLTENCRLQELIRFRRLFSGVMTPYFALLAEKAAPQSTFSLEEADAPPRPVTLAGICAASDRRFVFLSPEEEALRVKIEGLKRHDLKASCFALGIVTGDNRRWLADAPAPGLEPVLTGKEVGRYTIAPPRNYMPFSPKRFQQTAPLECYRAPEKLLYRFIADRPVFALDTQGTLCLNSVNVLIPHVPGMGIRTVLAFLNSDLFCWYYRKLLGGVKVLKGNLQKLPFPAITPAQDRELTLLVERILLGDASAHRDLQTLIHQIFSLSLEEIALVQNAL